ncbi:MAG: hypothetical protein V3U65_05505, partial [Granulosicoccaceae bacterium]
MIDQLQPKASLNVTTGSAISGEGGTSRLVVDPNNWTAACAPSKVKQPSWLRVDCIPNQASAHLAIDAV